MTTRNLHGLYSALLCPFDEKGNTRSSAQARSA